MKEKKCKECKRILTIDKFSKVSTTEEKYSNICKECIKERYDEWRTERIRKMERSPKELITEKQCPRCGRAYLIKYFYKKKDTADGYSLYCKSCVNDMNKESKKKWAEEHPEEYKEKILTRNQKLFEEKKWWCHGCKKYHWPSTERVKKNNNSFCKRYLNRLERQNMYNVS